MNTNVVKAGETKELSSSVTRLAGSPSVTTPTSMADNKAASPTTTAGTQESSGK